MNSGNPHTTEDQVRNRLAQPEERARLVRLCRHLTGSAETAEDLAQETLVEAWRNADKLRNADAWQPWLSGIARNVFLRWQRSHAREMSRRAAPQTPEGDRVVDLEEAARYEMDMDAALEQDEIRVLLDRAMASLPDETRTILVERYVHDAAPSEIAARHGWSENVTAVRLHRGKAALRRVLATDLGAEAAAYGLMDPEAEGWQETRIWCPICGARRLEARLVTRNGARHFRVRCEDCGDNLGPDFSTYHRAMDTSVVLGGVQAHKPALNRVSAWWHQRFQQALDTRRTPCARCGQPMEVVFTPPADTPELFRAIRGVYFLCHGCGGIGCFSPYGLTFGRADVQQFWREHPRIRALPEREIVVNGRPAVVIGYESVADSACLEIVLMRDNFQPLRVLRSQSARQQKADAPRSSHSEAA